MTGVLARDPTVRPCSWDRIGPASSDWHDTRIAIDGADKACYRCRARSRFAEQLRSTDEEAEKPLLDRADAALAAAGARPERVLSLCWGIPPLLSGPLMVVAGFSALAIMRNRANVFGWLGAVTVGGVRPRAVPFGAPLSCPPLSRIPHETGCGYSPLGVDC